MASKVSRPTLANHIAAGPVDSDYQVVVWSEALDGGQSWGLAKPDDAANHNYRSVREGDVLFFHYLDTTKNSPWWRDLFSLFVTFLLCVIGMVRATQQMSCQVVSR